MDQVKIAEIVLLSGETFTDAILVTEAPRIPGLFAIRGQLRNSVEYIALSAVSSLTVSEHALYDTSFAYYLAPETKVKVTK